jgi:hypothetical protein
MFFHLVWVWVKFDSCHFNTPSILVMNSQRPEGHSPLRNGSGDNVLDNSIQ